MPRNRLGLAHAARTSRTGFWLSSSSVAVARWRPRIAYLSGDLEALESESVLEEAQY